ncbi:MAG: hypothetical protein GY747_10435 [Planctomycetes bacterium]|nr:hypothetical protein [Planctomycetota bacterium]MCP4861720.1 hypothetical protein [Planctomycetota bacterium]
MNMHIPSSLFASTLAAIGLCSCQDAALPTQAVGPAAQEAFEQWADQIDFEAEFPVQISWDFTVEMVEKVPSMNVDRVAKVESGINLIAQADHSLLGWGNIGMDINLEEVPDTIELGFQIALDTNGFRLLLSPNEALLDTFPIGIPTAFQLSASRVDLLSAMWSRFTDESMRLNGLEDAMKWMDYDSALEIFHPANMLKAYVDNPMQEVVSWRMDGDQVHMTFAMREEALEPYLGKLEGDPGVEMLKQMQFNIVADRHTGEGLEIFMNVDIPMDQLLASGPGSGGNMKMKMEMSIAKMLIEPNPPAIIMPSQDKIMDLDKPFDDFQPVLENLVEMQLQSMKNMSGEAEAEEDFSF